MQEKSTLRKLDQAFVKLADGLAIISGVLMILISVLLFFDALSGKILSRNIPHSIEITTNFHIIIVYFALLAVQLSDGHANVELVYNKFPDIVKRVCVALWNVLGVVVCAFESYTSWNYMTDQLNNGTLSGLTGGFPLWPISACMLLGWVLMGLGCVWCLVRQFAKLTPVPGVAPAKGKEDAE